MRSRASSSTLLTEEKAVSTAAGEDSETADNIHATQATSQQRSRVSNVIALGNGSLCPIHSSTVLLRRTAGPALPTLTGGERVEEEEDVTSILTPHH